MSAYNKKHVRNHGTKKKRNNQVNIPTVKIKWGGQNSVETACNSFAHRRLPSTLPHIDHCIGKDFDSVVENLFPNHVAAVLSFENLEKLDFIVRFEGSVIFDLGVRIHPLCDIWVALPAVKWNLVAPHMHKLVWEHLLYLKVELFKKFVRGR